MEVNVLPNPNYCVSWPQKKLCLWDKFSPLWFVAAFSWGRDRQIDGNKHNRQGEAVVCAVVGTSFLTPCTHAHLPPYVKNRCWDSVFNPPVNKLICGFVFCGNESHLFPQKNTKEYLCSQLFTVVTDGAGLSYILVWAWLGDRWSPPLLKPAMAAVEWLPTLRIGEARESWPLELRWHGGRMGDWLTADSPTAIKLEKRAYPSRGRGNHPWYGMLRGKKNIEKSASFFRNKVKKIRMWNPFSSVNCK